MSAAGRRDDGAGEAAAGLEGAGRIAAAGLGGLAVLVAVGWSLDLPRILSLRLYPQQYFAAILALVLPLAFLVLPVRRGAVRGEVAWFDWLLAALALGAGGYVAVMYPEVVNQIFFRPPEAYVPGTILILLSLEALRRATGWPLVLIVAGFILYAMFGDMVPGRLAGKAQDWLKLAGYMAYDINGILGIPLAVASTIIVAFILFGSLLNLTGGSRFFTDAALIGMGRYRGGSMKIAVVASGLFGSISGSAVANVVATGVVTIPMIKRDGYPAHKAGAIEAVASTGGQLMPPVMGAAAFLMAEFLQVPYSEVVLAALIPALLYYGALFIQADLEAARMGIAGAPEGVIPKGRTVLGGLHFVLAFALLIYALFVWHWQPARAALLACGSVVLTALIFGYAGERVPVARMIRALTITGEAIVEIVVISAAAGMVIAVLNITGLSFNLTYALVQIGGGSAILLLVLSAIVCIILGMGLPTLGVYVLLAALVAPALVEVGIEPMAAHLFVLYFGMMSMITPPIALAAFAAATVAEADPMKTGLAAVKFGWIAFVIPFLFAFAPALIGLGGGYEIALAVGTALAGVWLVSAGLAGYFLSRIGPVTRGLFLLSGLALLVPSGISQAAWVSDVLGAGLGAALVIAEAVRARRNRPIGVAE